MTACHSNSTARGSHLLHSPWGVNFRASDDVQGTRLAPTFAVNSLGAAHLQYEAHANGKVVSTVRSCSCQPPDATSNHVSKNCSRKLGRRRCSRLAPALVHVWALDVYHVADVCVTHVFLLHFHRSPSVMNTGFRVTECTSDFWNKSLLNHVGKTHSLASPGLQNLSTSARAAVLGVA